MPKEFIPALWAKKVLKELDNQHMMVKNCSTKYSGEITGVGSSVKITNVVSPSITDYVPGEKITPDKLTDEARTLVITEAKKFSFFVEDIDAKQSINSGIKEGIRKAVVGLKDTAEKFIAAKFTEGNITVTQNALTGVNFFSTFSKAKRYLMKENVTEMIAEVSPEIWEKGIAANILYNQSNEDTIKEGLFVQSLGIRFFVSNNIEVTETSQDVALQTCAMRSKEAIGYAEQIMKIKEYDPDDYFETAVKGLHVYGAKTIKPNEMITMVLTTAAETEV